MVPSTIREDLDVLVPNLIVDLSARMKIDMGTNSNVEANPILVVESVMDVSIKIEIEIGTEPSVMIAELVRVVDVVFDIMYETDDLVYLMVFFIYLHYLNYHTTY